MFVSVITKHKCIENMETKKKKSPAGKRRREKNYPKGIPTAIARKVGCSPEYVERVLQGRHEGRETDTTKQIKEVAELVLAPLQ
jgi:hypothetical protein